MFDGNDKQEKSRRFSDAVIEHTEDQCTWQSILERGYVAYGLNENLALYRVTSDSLTANKRESAKRQWNVYREYHGFSIFKSGVYFASMLYMP